MAEKSADNLLSAVNKSKSNPLYKLINALGIRNVGEATARALAQKFKTLDNLKTASLDELQEVSDIGPEVAESVFSFFKNQSNIDVLDKLHRAGVNFGEKDEHEQNAEEKLFQNKTFVLTGTLPDISRNEAADIIRDLGGTVSSSISKNTSYLLAGENPGSKFRKAKKLGVEIIDWDQFNKLIDNSSVQTSNHSEKEDNNSQPELF